MEFFLEKIIGMIVANELIRIAAKIKSRGYRRGMFINLRKGISIRFLTETFLKIIEFNSCDIGTDIIKDIIVADIAEIMDSFR